MIDPSPSQLFLGENPASVPLPRGMVRAYSAVLGGLGVAATAGLLAMSIATNSGSEADRIAGARADGYGATLVSALTVDLAKPLR